MFIITHRKVFLAIGAFVVVISALLVATFGLRLGIDFTGGTLTEVVYEPLPERTAIETVLETQGLTGSAVRQTSGESGEGYLITTRTLTVEEQSALDTALLERGENARILRTTTIGPVIGAELLQKSYWAIGAVLLTLILYVAFAFRGVGYPVSSWTYGGLTVLMSFHDVLVPLAVMSVLGATLGYEVDVLFVTALLTILGYSVNDTIVIFDRVREKLVQNRIEHKVTTTDHDGMPTEQITYTLTRPFAEVVGEAVSETMARSINTSLTVIFALIALYVFGSVVTQTFVLVLMAGVVAGAYSSIFFASPLLVYIAERKAAKEAAATSTASTTV